LLSTQPNFLYRCIIVFVCYRHVHVVTGESKCFMCMTGQAWGCCIKETQMLKRQTHYYHSFIQQKNNHLYITVKYQIDYYVHHIFCIYIHACMYLQNQITFPSYLLLHHIPIAFIFSSSMLKHSINTSSLIIHIHY
jgi:hypothetical protein